MHRRKFIHLVAVSSLASTFAGQSSAKSLELTNRQTEGPFYPTVPIPMSSDLLLSTNHSGDELQLSGQVLNTQGAPIANARVEIWQCDGRGYYQHPAAPNTSEFDSEFRGFGATMTDAMGHYKFRTIVPVPYTGRPPHIHTKIFFGNKEQLTSQIYLKDKGGHKALKIDPIASADTQFTATFNFVV